MIDAAYFLMYPGWWSELRSNRWQWAKQWTSVVPVFLVQPTQPLAPRALRVIPDTRMPNASVLHVKSQSRSPTELEAATATGQIAAHLDSAGFERPLLWCYNPRLLGSYGDLPASARVFHATENHFEMERLDEEFLGRLRRAIELSDLTVAVSSGVARAVTHEVPRAKVAEVTNGCDFSFYAGARPDDQLRSLDGQLAIYAGNINSRLDFALLDRMARTRRDLTIVFVGPVRGLDRDDTRAWKLLLAQPNVRYLGAVEPERLPGLYAASDVGLIPYRATPLLVQNGFPLKALEMAATGLPMASTLLEPLIGLAEAIRVTEDDENFLAATHFTRSLLSENERSELLEVARRNDYAQKFAQVRGLVDSVAHQQPSPRTPLLVLQAEWRAHACSRPIVAAAALAERVLLGLLVLLPEDVQQRVSGRLRRTFNRLLSVG